MSYATEKYMRRNLDSGKVIKGSVALYDFFVESPKFQNLEDHRKQGYIQAIRAGNRTLEVELITVLFRTTRGRPSNQTLRRSVEWNNWKHWCERCP